MFTSAQSYILIYAFLRFLPFQSTLFIAEFQRSLSKSVPYHFKVHCHCEVSEINFENSVKLIKSNISFLMFSKICFSMKKLHHRNDLISLQFVVFILNRFLDEIIFLRSSFLHMIPFLTQSLQLHATRKCSSKRLSHKNNLILSLLHYSFVSCGHVEFELERK